MSHTLNSLEGDYTGGYMGIHIGVSVRVIKRDTRSLDYVSYEGH